MAWHGPKSALHWVVRRGGCYLVETGMGYRYVCERAIMCVYCELAVMRHNFSSDARSDV